MRKKPEINLKTIKTSPKVEGRVFQASNFLTDEEKNELIRINASGKSKRKLFDQIDAYVAEIISRFGYETYKAWNNGEIPEKRMAKLIYAERARDAARIADIEAVIISMVGSLVKKEKGKPSPKGPKTALKILQNNAKLAKGEK